jgi:hypothetical protein
MPHPRTTRISRQVDPYVRYSLACAAVWAVILAVAQRRLDVDRRKGLQLWCLAWWSGWTSATIARHIYPPPTKLGPQAETRLGVGSVVLIAVGIISVIRQLAGARRPAAPTGG